MQVGKSPKCPVFHYEVSISPIERLLKDSPLLQSTQSPFRPNGNRLHDPVAKSAFLLIWISFLRNFFFDISLDSVVWSTSRSCYSFRLYVVGEVKRRGGNISTVEVLERRTPFLMDILA